MTRFLLLFWLAFEQASAAIKTNTVLTLSPGSATVGARVTLTANVTPAGATGRVMFFDGVASLGTAHLSSGMASLATTLLGSGAHRLLAVYIGDLFYDPGASAVVSEIVTAKTENVLAVGAVPAVPSQQTIDQLSVTDLNGDGNADMVIVSTFSGISVLLGNGDGTFGKPINSGIRASAVQVGDFNADGNPDLVYLTFTPTQRFAASLGRGDGTFQPPILSPPILLLANTVSPSDFRIGDFNRDGKLDIVTVAPVESYSSVGQILVMVGNGDGSFRPPASHPGPTLFTPRLAAIGDFNADGKPDLLLETESGNHNQCIEWGKGDGTFQSGSCFTVPSVSSIAVADMDGDGRDDLVLASQMPRTVTVLLFNGDGSFTAHGQPLLDFPSFITTGDFTGDGKADLVVIGQHGGANGVGLIAVLPGNGDGTFQNPGYYSPAGVSYPSCVAAGDFNHDGKLDLITGSNLLAYAPLNALFGFMASVAIAGSGQTTAPGQRFPSALQVTIRDEIGTPIPGVSLLFAAPNTGSSVVFSPTFTSPISVAETDQYGTVSADATANLLAGNYAVTVGNGFLQTSFSLSNSLDSLGSFTVVPSTVAPNTTVS